jgi:uncharacterized protein (TIGR02444 family)
VTESNLSKSADQFTEQAIQDFWEISCEFYALPAISSTLLTLQNSFGLQVNRLLFTLWFSYRIKQRIPAKPLKSALKLINTAEDAVEQIRSCRLQQDKNYPKPHIGNHERVRYHLLEAELAMEKEVQCLLVKHFVSEAHLLEVFAQKATISAAKLSLLVTENVTLLGLKEAADHNLEDQTQYTALMQQIIDRWLEYLEL